MGGTGDSDPLRLEGYASVFNSLAKLPGFREQIKPGAFKRAIEQRMDVVALWNHNDDIVLGRTTSGTLRLNQDSRGLHYTIDLPNTQTARDIHESVRRGDINGSSFAFNVPEGGQDWSEQRDADGTFYVQRDINDVNLLDVSPVTHPAYQGTEVYARDMEGLVPTELRSAVDAKNAAAQVPVIVPPAIEKRPYSSVDEVPDSVPAAHKAQWMEVWNNVYKKALANGSSKEDAEAAAFKQANGVVKKAKARSVREQIEVRGVENKREMDSLEDTIKEVCLALAAAFPRAANGVQTSAPAPMMDGRFYEMETFQDEEGDGYVIVGDYTTGEYFSITFNHDESKDEGNEITFGEPQSVEKEWVPSDRTAKRLAEQRDMVERDDEEDEEDDLDDDFDMAYKGRAYRDGEEHEDHEDGGMCEEAGCICQNRWAPSGSGYRSTDYVGELMFVGLFDEQRGGMARTKRVGGKDLTAKSFAFVGDPNRTETWKYPIHDAVHARLALSRWGQHKGIPSDKEAGVYRKIVAAAKKFGIKVSEEKSWPIMAEERKAFADRLAKAMRYSDDQPRDEKGRFGEGTGEKSKSSEEHQISSREHASAAAGHRLAAQDHANQAQEAAKAGDTQKESAHDHAEAAHLAAAQAHTAAASAHMTGSKAANASSRIANHASAVANKMSDRA